MKSETNWIIAGLGLGLWILLFMAFFFEPKYEKLVWFGAGVFGGQLANVLGFKFGRSMPQQSTDARPGQTADVTSKITTVPDPPAEIPVENKP